MQTVQVLSAKILSNVYRGNTAPFGGGGVILWENDDAAPEIPRDMKNCGTKNFATYGPCVGRF